ncbi:MAG: hypothetical protein V9G10_13700 [Candidatus Nanopelagicales bacterium]
MRPRVYIPIGSPGQHPEQEEVDDQDEQQRAQRGPGLAQGEARRRATGPRLPFSLARQRRRAGDRVGTSAPGDILDQRHVVSYSTS